MLQASKKLTCIYSKSLERSLHQRHYTMLRNASRPRINSAGTASSNMYRTQQIRSISIIPSIARFAFSAVRLPLVIGGVTVTGVTIASNKIQDIKDKGDEFLSSAKEMFSKMTDGIEDIDIQVPEMRFKLSELLSRAFSKKEKSGSVNHTLNSSPTMIAAENEVISPAIKEVGIKIDQTIKQEAQEEPIEEESEAETLERIRNDAMAMMQHQDQQFILLCRKFTDIRNTLISIHHQPVPYVPSIVVIGPRQSCNVSILETILGQPFLSREHYSKGVLEIQFINDPNLQEPIARFANDEKSFTIKEAERLTKEFMQKEENCNKPLLLSISGSNIPYVNVIDIPEENVALCDKYIGGDPQSIIMAIHDTSSSFSSSITTKICNKFDPLGRRTAGVLVKSTQIAKVNEKNELAPASELVKEYYPPLNLGYIDMSLQDIDIDKEKEQRILRHKILGVIEQSMGRSIYSIVDSIKNEFEETAYKFKVNYNDRPLTAYSYVTDSMDELKVRFKEFASKLGKPQLRHEVRTLLEQDVLNICAEQYWSDAKILQLAKASEDDFYWLYKMDLASSAITKSGIGRTTTQVVIDVIMNNMERLVKIEPLQYHPKVQKQIINFTGDILKQKYYFTSDQVENTIKPFKYEVEVTDEEWKDGIKRTVTLMEKELSMCEDMIWTIKRNIGRKRLRSAIKHVLDEEKSTQNSISSVNKKVLTEANDKEAEEQVQSPRILEKAKEALFLQDRAMILRYRISTLKSRQCKTQENKQYCPEAFLNIIAEKLTYTAVMFIQIELLNDFFLNFPLDVLDNKIVHPMKPLQIEKLAKENPSVQKHLDLQERKMKLEKVMDMLNYLVKRHGISSSH